MAISTAASGQSVASGDARIAFPPGQLTSSPVNFETGSRNPFHNSLVSGSTMGSGLSAAHFLSLLNKPSDGLSEE